MEGFICLCNFVYMKIHTIHEKDMNKFIRLNGEYFGYPKCCVNAMIRVNGWGYEKANDDQKNATGWTGFIPCKKCAKKIVSGKIELKDLIKNRICKSPFPLHGRAIDRDKYVLPHVRIIKTEFAIVRLSKKMKERMFKKAS